MSRSSWLVAIAVAQLAGPRSAAADTAAAEAAFAEAKRLMAAGKIAEACRAFEISHKQDPQIGTLLNLADCHDQQGKLASAWAEFRAAMELAKNRGDARESFARERSEQLAPRVSHVTLVNDDDVPGVQVEIDGRDVTELVGVPIPVDPGEHTITTRVGDAEGSTTIDIPRKRRQLTVHIPLDAPRAERLPPDGSTRNARRTRQVIALSTGGAGLALAAIGLYFGKVGFDRYDESRAFCDDANRCDPQGAALVDDARSAATKANILVGLGALAVTAGVVLWVTAPSEARGPTVSARAIAAPGHVAGALIVHF